MKNIFLIIAVIALPIIGNAQNTIQVRSFNVRVSGLTLCQLTVLSKSNTGKMAIIRLPALAASRVKNQNGATILIKY